MAIVAVSAGVQHAPASAEGFVGELQRITSDIWSQQAPSTMSISVAGVPTAILTPSGPTQEAFTRSLAHLPPADAAPDVVMSCWSSSAAGRPFPRPGVKDLTVTHRGDIPALASEDFPLSFNPAAHYLSAANVGEGRSFDVCESVDRLRSFERAAPMRASMAWLLRDRARHVIHAAAIAVPEGAVLLVGRGGAGKSTTALRALAQGWHFLGDDLVAVSSDGSNAVHSLYCSAKAVPGTDTGINARARVGSWEEPGGKMIYLLDELYGGRLRLSAPLRAIVIIDRSAGRLSVQAGSPAHAVAIAASTTYRLIPGTQSQAMQALSAIARRVPVWRMDPGAVDNKTLNALQALVEHS